MNSSWIYSKSKINRVLSARKRLRCRELLTIITWKARSLKIQTRWSILIVLNLGFMEVSSSLWSLTQISDWHQVLVETLSNVKVVNQSKWRLCSWTYQNRTIGLAKIQKRSDQTQGRLSQSLWLRTLARTSQTSKSIFVDSKHSRQKTTTCRKSPNRTCWTSRIF